MGRLWSWSMAEFSAGEKMVLLTPSPRARQRPPFEMDADGRDEDGGDGDANLLGKRPLPRASNVVHALSRATPPFPSADPFAADPASESCSRTDAARRSPFLAALAGERQEDSPASVS